VSARRPPAQAEVIPGFRDINRYWDRRHAMPAAKILPGQYYVTRHAEMITTVLGSCVAACIRDPLAGVGGMNHFMLPRPADDRGWAAAGDCLSSAMRYGNHAMEHMINCILVNGGRRERLEAKIFGGGMIISNLSDVGRMNIDFVRDYLAVERIELVGEDVGDVHPRKVIYLPGTGRALVKRIRQLHNDRVVRRESAYRDRIEAAPVRGEVELFG
jgi:chemotaxis protein CheD